MTDIVLRDIDTVLAERIRRVADQRGWGMSQTLLHLLEQGLFAHEGEVGVNFDAPETDALQAAIAALEQVPDDVYAQIGQLPAGGDAGDQAG